MLDKKDELLAQEFREVLTDCEVKVLDSDLPKLVSKFYDELNITGKERNNETEGEAFELVASWAHESFNLTGEYINWFDSEISKDDSMPNLDYGTDDIRNKTAVIRFHIKVKSKRKKLYDFWNKYCSMDTRPNLDEVSTDFISLFKNNEEARSFKKLDLKWCSWADQYCLYELIYGIKSVTDHDEFLYICFDTSVVPNMPKAGMESSTIDPLLNLVFILSFLDGVKKVWIKARPASRYYQELYTCWPMIGDWPWALEVDVTTDDTWNELT